MRKYAFLKTPLQEEGDRPVFKIMLFETPEGICLFEYDSPDAVMCFADRLYDRQEDLFEDWNDLIDERGWIALEDPLPFCQHDAFIPLRVRGRNIGRPEWGVYETLKDGQWVPYEPV